MFSFKQSRFHNYHLAKSPDLSSVFVSSAIKYFDEVYNVCQFVLRDPTDKSRSNEFLPFLATVDVTIDAMYCKVPVSLREKWNRMVGILKDLVQLTKLTITHWRYAEDNMDVRILYSLFFRDRTRRLYIEASINFLRYMDIQFNIEDGYGLTCTHIRQAFDKIRKSIGSSPFNLYFEIFDNYFYYEVMVTKRRYITLTLPTSTFDA